MRSGFWPAMLPGIGRLGAGFPAHLSAATTGILIRGRSAFRDITSDTCRVRGDLHLRASYPAVRDIPHPTTRRSPRHKVPGKAVPGSSSRRSRGSHLRHVADGASGRIGSVWVMVHSMPRSSMRAHRPLRQQITSRVFQCQYQLAHSSVFDLFPKIFPKKPVSANLASASAVLNQLIMDP